MNNYFIIHGSFGNPFGNWFEWLNNEIEKNKPESQEESICYVPHFPTGVGFQNFENWERVLLAYKDCGLLGKESIIFAHSIAPVFVCKFLIKHKIKVKRLVFVCGFNNYLGINADYDAVNVSMYLNNLADVKNYCDDIICLYSDNDPYVNFEVEKEFADTVSNKQIIIENGGHLNASFGFKEFPQLKEFI